MSRDNASNHPGRELEENELLISPDQLQLGHFVTRLDRPWLNTPYPLEGVMLESSEDRAWMEIHCHWVIVDLERSRNQYRPPNARGRQPAPPRPIPAKASAVHALRNSSVDPDSMAAAIQGYDSLGSQARRLIQAFAEQQSLDVEQAEVVVRELSASLEKNIGALVWLTRIKEKDDYTAQHCINVAILAMGLGHALDWKTSEIELAGLAGLLHDLGKVQLDMSIINKPGRLTPEEFRYVQSHTTLGYEMVREDPGVPDVVARAILEHHERPDGLGYPNRKADGEFNPTSALVSVVDAYDAITSHRVYDEARSHHEALGILWEQRGKQFDAQMVETFIQFMGWVTPGTLVRLSTGALAVVTETRVGQRLNPIVRLLHKNGSGYVGGPTWDLAAMNEGKERSVVRITRILPDGTKGVDLRRISEDIARRD